MAVSATRPKSSSARATKKINRTGNMGKNHSPKNVVHQIKKQPHSRMVSKALPQYTEKLAGSRATRLMSTFPLPHDAKGATAYTKANTPAKAPNPSAPKARAIKIK